MLDYTALTHLAIQDMAKTVPALRHLRPEYILVVAARRVSKGQHGNLAQCHSLMEKETRDLAYWYHRRTRKVVKVTPWTITRNTAVYHNNQPMRYVILLRLPRLLSHSPLETLAHELIHVGPACDGKMREMRHGKSFNRVVEEVARVWKARGNPELVEMLQMNHRTLRKQHGKLVGQVFEKPFQARRLEPLENPPPQAEHPDFNRLGLTFNAKRVQVVEADWTSKRYPQVLTERDLAWRMFIDGRTEKISAAIVRTSAWPHQKETQ